MLEPKNVVLVIFILVNLIFLFVKKDLLNIVLGVVISFILIMWYASESIASQKLFYEIVIYLSLTLIFMTSILLRLQKFNKKDLLTESDKKFSINRSFLMAMSFVSTLLFSIFLVVSDPVTKSDQEVVAKATKKLDINNTNLAKAKYDSKTAILNENSIFVDMFSQLDKVIVLTVFLLCFLLLVNDKKEIFFDKK